MASAPNRSPILPCVDHALPYQVIFEEHRARRPWDLLFATLEAFPEFSPEDVKDTRWNDLVKQRDDAISKLNERRRNLAELEAQLGKTDAEVQDQLAYCDTVNEVRKGTVNLKERPLSATSAFGESLVLDSKHLDGRS